MLLARNRRQPRHLSLETAIASGSFATPRVDTRECLVQVGHANASQCRITRVPAETAEIIITRHGKPAGVLIGFESEEDWFDYRLEHDPRFLQRVESARTSLHAGRGVKLEDIK